MQNRRISQNGKAVVIHDLVKDFCNVTEVYGLNLEIYKNELFGF
jgi:hypothetical protein